jgi:hypothetical protein
MLPRPPLLATPIAPLSLPPQAAHVISWILERQHQHGAWEAV